HRLVVEPFAEIGGLVVIEEWRASGVGRALLKTAETWARDRVVSGMRVRSNIIREGAQRFYEHLGYNNVKTQKVFLKELVLKDYKSS
ncbi:MAG: GNAT family N-acetyltransferase, partial [Anaerolineales bacterium]|nr:GNAT family N-acetyltransferase [Anaerolineales bacterium]